MHYNSVAFIFSRVSGSSNQKRDFLCLPIRHFQCLWNHPIEWRITEVPERRHIQKCRSKVSLDSYAEKWLDNQNIEIPFRKTNMFFKTRNCRWPETVGFTVSVDGYFISYCVLCLFFHIIFFNLFRKCFWAKRAKRNCRRAKGCNDVWSLELY